MVLAAVVVVTGLLTEVAANAAPLPASWRPWLWVAWPGLGLAAVVLIVLELRSRTGEPGSARMAAAPPPVSPPPVVQTITAAGPGSTAVGALYGDVIHHPAPLSAPGHDDGA
jgi:hypothetical protein